MQYGPVSGASGGGGGGSGLAERDTPWWVLQDGGGDVVAVVKDNGWSAGGNSATASTVAGQYVYDAYGSVLAAESLATHPALHLGHKGLFFDRLDVGVVDSLGAENPRLDQGAHATYYMRNRWYSPETGRFLQRDPNATSMVLIESAASHGRGIGAAVAALSPDAMYGDGHNLYQYLGSNPWLRRDPLGLSADPFDDVDEYIALDAASKAAFLGDILDGVHAVAVVAAAIVSFLPIPGAAFVGELAIALLNGEDIGPALLSAGVGLVPGGRLALLGLSIVHDLEEIGQWAEEMGGAGGEDGTGGLLDLYPNVDSEILGGEGHEMAGVVGKLGTAGRAGKRLTGQLHHAISNRVLTALERNPKTRGVYNRESPGLKTRAATPSAHSGWFGWHADFDNEVVAWIRKNKPTPKQFEQYLKNKYNSKTMKAKFPGGIKFPPRKRR